MSKPAAVQNAPDQSTRILSAFVKEMRDSNRDRTMDILCAQLQRASELDAWFLQGGAAELGVTPNKDKKPAYEGVCARALWESHWREEYCGVYDTHVAFFAPLGKKPVFFLHHRDILGVRTLPSEKSPVPGLYTIAIDTPGRVTYLAFSEEDKVQNFAAQLKVATFRFGSDGLDFREDTAPTSDPRENFVLKSGQWAGVAGSNKNSKRVVLNARRMRFDASSFGEGKEEAGEADAGGTEEGQKVAEGREQTGEEGGGDEGDDTSEAVKEYAQFTENLLGDALALSTESSLEDLIQFLDKSSCLRNMKIGQLDFTAEESVVIFVNIYHCLLQHALLLLGPPSKHSVSHFMRCVCYEIGNDVFSLAELEHCVIRGKLSLPSSNRSMFVEPAKSSEGFKKYSLACVDARINFVLHSGLNSSGSVPILTTKLPLSRQLNEIATRQIERVMKVDSNKRVVVLPEVCKVFRDDFGDDNVACLKFLLRFLTKQNWEVVSWVLVEKDKGKEVKFKYQSSGEFTSGLLKG